MQNEKKEFEKHLITKIKVIKWIGILILVILFFIQVARILLFDLFAVPIVKFF